MSELNRRKVIKHIGLVIIFLLMNACSQTPTNANRGTLEATPQTIAFMEAYLNDVASRTANINSGPPLQMSARVGPSSDPDVCVNGELYGPYTLSGGAVTGGNTVSASQPSLRLTNMGTLSVCMIVTSAVNADLELELNKVYVEANECELSPAYLGGVWTGDYSCDSSCDDESGTVRFTLLQDGYSATYSDGSASYEGTVCGNIFEYSGGGPGYTESGTFTLNSNGTGSKTSRYQSTYDSCSGTCSDPVLTQVFNQAVLDDFDDASLDVAWILSSENSQNGILGWTYEESESSLTFTDVSAEIVHDSNGQEYSRFNLTRDITSLTDFIAEFNLSWDSDDNSAMQSFSVELYRDDNSARIASAGFADAWIGSSGQQTARVGDGPLFASGPGTLTNTGSASIKIVREGEYVRILWDGETLHEGVSVGDMGIIQMSVGHYPFDDGMGLLSSFGTISIDSIRVSGIEAP